MGAKARNFYNALVARYGWEAEAAAIQDLYLAGPKAEAEAAIPAELLEKTSLVGPEGYLKDGSPPSGRPGSPCSTSRPSVRTRPGWSGA